MTEPADIAGTVPSLREMSLVDLSLVAGWLSEPHVARWYLAGSSVDREVEDLRQSVERTQPVHALVVSLGERPIGWCQWYLCASYPEWADDIGAGPDEVAVDYAIGDPARIGKGVGTEVIALLIETIRAQRPGCPVVADPDELNVASRRVLEKNGFGLVTIKSIPSEPTGDPVAIYRLPGSTVRLDGRGQHGGGEIGRSRS